MLVETQSLGDEHWLRQPPPEQTYGLQSRVVGLAGAQVPAPSQAGATISVVPLAHELGPHMLPLG